MQLTVDGNMDVRYVSESIEWLSGQAVRRLRGRPLLDIMSVPDPQHSERLRGLVRACLSGDAKDQRELAGVTIDFPGGPVKFDILLEPIEGAAGEISGASLQLRQVQNSGPAVAASEPDTLFSGPYDRASLARIISEVAAKNPGEVAALGLFEFCHLRIVRDCGGLVASDRMLAESVGVIRSTLGGLGALYRLDREIIGVLLRGSPADKAGGLMESVRRSLYAHSQSWEGSGIRTSVACGWVKLNHWYGRRFDLDRLERITLDGARQHRDRVFNCTPDSRTATAWSRRLGAASSLIQSLDAGRIVLQLQPIVALSAYRGGSCCDRQPRFEILTALVDESGERVAATDFLSAAEDYGLMPELDKLVVQRAFASMSTMCASAAYANAEFFINLSAQSIPDDGLLAHIGRQLEVSKVPACNVCFELTETVSLGDLGYASDFVGALRGMGFKVAIDDFGSGFASFSYLKALDVDFVKIDGSFVRGMLHDARNHAVVRAVREICGDLGIATIAEQVEDVRTLEELARLGVDYAQGYALGRPWEFHRSRPS